MPIYAYRCTACGHAQDVLQKISDPVLTQCPACGAAAYAKQVTAAGFQLKGSGWYVTDFRDGKKAPAKPDAPGGDAPAAKAAADKAPGDGGDPAAAKADPPAAKAVDKPAGKPVAAADAKPAAAPAEARPASAPPPATGR